VLVQPGANHEILNPGAENFASFRPVSMEEVITQLPRLNHKNRVSAGHGDDPEVMVMILLSHSMILSIISPHKLADMAGNLMLMILPSH
jgi:hypothetical protein